MNPRRTPAVWIKRTLKRIAAGTYEPETPERFKAGKSLGFSRTITFPSIPDLVLYRAIADYLFHKAKGRQHRHVYFQRGDASQADEARLSPKFPPESGHHYSLSSLLEWR